MKAKVETVRVPCRFCDKEIWAQSDNKEPTCEECGDLEADAYRDSYEIEMTLHPLTEWRIHESQASTRH